MARAKNNILFTRINSSKVLGTDQRAQQTSGKNKMSNPESYNGTAAESMVSLAAAKGSSALKANRYLQ